MPISRQAATQITTPYKGEVPHRVITGCPKGGGLDRTSLLLLLLLPHCCSFHKAAADDDDVDYREFTFYVCVLAQSFACAQGV